ncbi:MAG: guanylate kinase [Bacteroidetes bacterium]|nr:guanylate kinase [Bacteroidota bacterium]
MYSNAHKGKLIIFSAPSGAGKTTIVHHLLKKDFGLEFSVSACTRKQREGEVHGKDYYYLSIADFKQNIDLDEFVEWEEVYKDNFYGTLKSEIERIWKKGKHVIFDVDVDGGLNLKKAFGDRALAIFVMPPSIEALRERLEQRDTETPESIARRIGKAPLELEKSSLFDTIIVNSDLEIACAKAEQVVGEFLKGK